MYSALKRDGRPLYELARRGIEVERAARPVVIHELELEGFELPGVRLRVRCSKGTYVRTLAEDIGRALGCGAHLSGLTRTAIGSLRLDSAVTAARIEGTSLAERDRLLLATETLLGSLPRLILEALDTARFRQGQLVTVAAAAAAEANHDGTRCVYGPDGLFLGIGEVDAGARLQPRRLVVSASTLVAKHAE